MLDLSLRFPSVEKTTNVTQNQQIQQQLPQRRFREQRLDLEKLVAGTNLLSRSITKITIGALDGLFGWG